MLQWTGGSHRVHLTPSHLVSLSTAESTPFRILVIVKEPTVQETISILRGIKERYEVHHAVRIMDAALIAAAELAKRYITSRNLPDSVSLFFPPFLP